MAAKKSKPAALPAAPRHPDPSALLHLANHIDEAAAFAHGVEMAIRGLGSLHCIETGHVVVLAESLHDRIGRLAADLATIRERPA